MNYANRIRLYLLAVAIVPPLLIMVVLYYSLEKSADNNARRQAQESIDKYNRFENNLFKQINSDINQALNRDITKSIINEINRNQDRPERLQSILSRFDFAEFIDDSSIVLASMNRPAITDRKLFNDLPSQTNQPSKQLLKIEYDRFGPHLACAVIYPIEYNLWLYAGIYFDSSLINQIEDLIDTNIDLTFEVSNNNILSRLNKSQLYQLDSTYVALLQGSVGEEYYLSAQFPLTTDLVILPSLLNRVILVSIISIVLAIALGLIITGKTKREIDNLIEATDRIAKGDFDTPVMAYQAGQFSQLADSFSDMITRLKKMQHKLSTSEKIAAWQMVGRKIAHELKNPLTPISIGIDDLKLAYQDSPADFEKTLNETTSMVRSEIKRMNDLLNEFVSFARMKTSQPEKVKLSYLLNDIEKLYQSELNNKKLIIKKDSADTTVNLDMDMIKQVLINLIKNGFETGENTQVQLVAFITNDNLNFKIEDSGPGFSEERLANSFQPFASTKPDGSGLGLVICHRIIHDHGGTMLLYNSNDGGGGVEITLPLN